MCFLMFLILMSRKILGIKGDAIVSRFHDSSRFCSDFRILKKWLGPKWHKFDLLMMKQMWCSEICRSY